jgi:Uma2 family endonuclease
LFYPMTSTVESISELLLKRWTVANYHRMITSGVLTSDDRVELLDGQVIEMVPQDPPHASTTDEGSDYLKALFAGRAKVRAQLPVTLSDHSEPEPDIAVVRIDENRYRDRHPNPADIFLLIEIADATLKRDRTHKAKLYAQANVPEYWIVDVNQRQLIVFRDPQDGMYQSEAVLTATDRVAPLAFPDIAIELQNLLIAHH